MREGKRASRIAKSSLERIFFPLNNFIAGPGSISKALGSHLGNSPHFCQVLALILLIQYIIIKLLSIHRGNFLLLRVSRLLPTWQANTALMIPKPKDNYPVCMKLEEVSALLVCNHSLLASGHRDLSLSHALKFTAFFWEEMCLCSSHSKVKVVNHALLTIRVKDAILNTIE